MTQPILKSKNCLFFNQYRYCLKAYQEAAWILRGFPVQERYIKSRIEFYQRQAESRGFLWGSLAESAWSWPAKDLPALDPQHIYLIAKNLNQMGVKNFKLVVERHCMRVYHNDLACLEQFANDLPFLKFVEFYQANIDHLPGQVLLKKSDYRYRTFINVPQGKANTENQSTESIRIFLNDRLDQLKPSPTTMRWLDNRIYFFWWNQKFFFDHNNQKLLVMMALIDPKSVGKTLDIVIADSDK